MSHVTGCWGCETRVVCPRHGASPSEPNRGTRANHSERREELRDSVLCEEHAHYYDLGPGEFTPAAPPESDDDPIECELCSLAAMRAAGVL